MCDSVESLTTAMAAGDPAAVTLFYRDHFDFLFVEAARATGRDESFCLDVVQEAVIRIIRSIRPASSAAQLSAWLRLVVRTTAYDLLRAERRRRCREQSVAPSEDSSSRAAWGEEDEERMAWLRQQIAAFDEPLARMIELRYERRWTLARVATALGLSVGAVDGRLRRALRELRSRAAEELEHPHV